MMSSHLALPRVGHLKELYHIIAYLKSHPNDKMVFDPTLIRLNMSMFERQEWSYSNVWLQVAEGGITKQYAGAIGTIDDDACLC